MPSSLRLRQKSFYVGSRKDRTWRTYMVEVWAERDGRPVPQAVVRIRMGGPGESTTMLLPLTGGSLTVMEAEPVLRALAHAMSLARGYERDRIKAVSGISAVSEPAGSVD